MLPNWMICAWRPLNRSHAQSVSLDTSAVLRCALGPRPGWAAVATLDGMYYMDPVDASQAPSAPHTHTPPPPPLPCHACQCMQRFGTLVVQA